MMRFIEKHGLADGDFLLPIVSLSVLLMLKEFIIVV